MASIDIFGIYDNLPQNGRAPANTYLTAPTLIPDLQVREEPVMTRFYQPIAAVPHQGITTQSTNGKRPPTSGNAEGNIPSQVMSYSGFFPGPGMATSAPYMPPASENMWNLGFATSSASSQLFNWLAVPTEIRTSDWSQQNSLATQQEPFMPAVQVPDQAAPIVAAVAAIQATTPW
ncbi:hypothetical protein HDU67_005683, partial [Dinochytrium kinnereticum]